MNTLAHIPNKIRVLLWLAACLFTIAGLFLYQWLFADLPAFENLTAYATTPSSKIYDRHGRLLFEMPPPYTGSHTPVPLDAVPAHLRRATIATEDATFYQNPGMDAWAILRAAWINVQGGEVLAGGSTITQQLVRTLMFSPDEQAARTLRRKLRELVLAVRITRHYTKDEILTLYLNETYYGNMAYGVEAASQAYFSKHVGDLDLAECALLVGLPQLPAIYNPLENLPAAKERQAVVLDLMVKREYITAEQAALAKEEALAFAAAPFPIRAPHFVMYVRGLLEQELGLPRLAAGGLNIYTTLDIDLNETGRDVMRQRLTLLANCYYQTECPPGGHNVNNAALVVLNPHTGEILAMVGSPDYFSTAIDGAVNGSTALRQPGSSVKPITYAAAFAPTHKPHPLTAATMMLDVRTSFVTREGVSYVPLNYDLVFRGPVRLREALASSYNLIAVKVLDTIGIKTMTDQARQMGITTFASPDQLGLAVTLGGGEVKLLELTAAYAAFANGGRYTSPRAIQRVEDADGTIVWMPDAALGGRVLDSRVAYLITDILSDDLARVPTFGEESVLKLTRPAAVKTGTTTNFRDNWTVGYTPDLVAGVWVGNADNRPMRDVSGVTGAAPIWHIIMEAAHNGRRAPGFTRPNGLVEIEVCATSGHLPGPDCPHRVTELFIHGTEPTATCAMHQRVGEQVYTILPPEAQTWGREHNMPQPPMSTSFPEWGTQVPIAVGQAVAPVLLILTSPDTGAVYHIDRTVSRDSQRISVQAEAGMLFARITLQAESNGGALVDLATCTDSPCRVWWPLQVGAHTFYAVGVDAQGVQVVSPEVVIEVVK